MNAIRAQLCLLIFCLPGLAMAGFFDKSSRQNDFLSADEAFVLETLALDAQRVQARWIIAPQHYLYKHRLQIEWLDAPGQSLSWLAPTGDSYHDEHFGEVEIYRDILEFVVTLPANISRATLRFHWQGCAEAGLCYPPQKQDMTVELTP